MVAVALGLIFVVGCDTGETTQTRFSDTFESPEAMADHLLRCMKESDKAGLHTMLLSKFEHDSIVAPAMGRTNDTEFGWLMLRQNCLKGVDRNLHMFGGRDFELRYVKFEEGTEVYDSLILHRGTVLGVLDRETGETLELHMCGTVIEDAGRFKLVSIRD